MFLRWPMTKKSFAWLYCVVRIMRHVVFCTITFNHHKSTIIIHKNNKFRTVHYSIYIYIFFFYHFKFEENKKMLLICQYFAIVYKSHYQKGFFFLLVEKNRAFLVKRKAQGFKIALVSSHFLSKMNSSIQFKQNCFYIKNNNDKHLYCLTYNAMEQYRVIVVTLQSFS